MKLLRLDKKCDLCQGKAELVFIADSGDWDVTVCRKCLTKMAELAATVPAVKAVAE